LGAEVCPTAHLRARLGRPKAGLTKAMSVVNAAVATAAGRTITVDVVSDIV
jgi:hypothetical protein